MSQSESANTLAAGHDTCDDPVIADWRACHLFYHEEQNRLIRGLIRPLMAELLAGGEVERFYFVRYNLGGPHVRLRWRAGGRETRAGARISDAFESFVARAPSTESVDAERIHQLNRSVLSVDPLAKPEDDVAYPDNSWRAFPVHFEVERYGGLERSGAALELFTASSIRALEMLDETETLSPGQAQVRFVRFVIQLAAAFARTKEELISLAGYGVRFMGTPLKACVERGDEFFGQQQEPLTAVAEHALECGVLSAEPLAEAIRLYRPALDGLEQHKQWNIAASHLHMTANRLGLLNTDEVYLSRIAERAVRALMRENGNRWSPFPAEACAPENDLEAWVNNRFKNFHCN